MKDFFLSHASENKNIIRQISNELEVKGYSTWLDEAELTIGDSLSNEIQKGIIESHFIVILLSREFLLKGWTNEELQASISLQISKGRKLILPIVIDLTHKDLQQHYPFIGDKLYLSWEGDAKIIADKLEQAYLKQTSKTSKPLIKPISIKTYCNNLATEINNNLVLEIFDRPHYDDVCITPIISSISNNSSETFSIYKIKHNQRVSIIGEPGSGKTTALRKLALDLLKDESQELLPIYISLASFDREFDVNNCSSFRTFIENEIELYGLNISLRQLESQYQTILLLDGWDEISSEKSRNEIKRFLASVQIPFIITSRPESQRSLPYSDFFEMTPLSYSRMLDFVKLRIKDVELVNKIIAWIKIDQSLYKLARNPLNLSIITIVSQDYSSFELVNKSKLYERAFECILNQYNRENPFDGVIDDRNVNKVSSIINILSKLAFTSVKEDKGRFFNLYELNNIAEDILGFTPNNLSKILAGKLGVIRDRRSSRMEFFHLWYQEYLAAKYIIENQVGIEIINQNKSFDSVFPYIIGLRPNKTVTKDLIFKKVINEPFTFCRSIKEGNFDLQTLKELILKVIDFGESSNPQLPVRLVLSKALAIIDKEAIKPLREILVDETKSDYARRCSLESLVMIDRNKDEIEKIILAIIDKSSEGLLWHIIEHIGNYNFKRLIPALDEYCSLHNPITSGDAIWALNKIDIQVSQKRSFEKKKELVELLRSDDPHIQGHALRTIGRLKIDAISELQDHLRDKRSAYRWIVPEAAALLNNENIFQIFELSLRDNDLKVVANSLISLKNVKLLIPDNILDLVKQMFERSEWIPHLNQRLGAIALDSWKHIINNRESKIANIYLSRHCKTQWNIDKRLQGSKDLPLSDEGKQQAQENIKNLKLLKIDRILTSNTKRAFETGEIYSKYFKVPVNIHTGLREIDHGDWEGNIIPEMLENQDSKYGEWLSNPENVELPNSKESMNMAQERILQAIKDIYVKYPNENILVVSHKHIRSLLFCALKNEPISCFQQNIQETILPQKIDSNLIFKDKSTLPNNV